MVEPEPDDTELARRVAEARPEADALTRTVLRSRVEAALFGATDRVTVGRYRLIRPLGRGGAGTVFVAEDPELHREVAVKLIRCASPRHRERALREARALARLSHPNVVPAHDVGETSDHVYLVMELLRGATLRSFAADPQRTIGQLVAAYRAAAAGLGAAHALGLVHRDFKPDNAIFGADDRLRVVDFGLASDGDESDPIGGTPPYMAPEQRRPGRATAAIDQYALGVALHEAATSAGRSAPAWLARVIARATAPDPAARYPAIADLDAALADDPVRRWRRRALIAAPIALAAVGFTLGRGATSDACSGGDAALAPAWTAERSAHATQRIEQLGTPFAAAIAPLISARSRAVGETWLAAHHRSCAAHARGELGDDLFDRATVCLARSRADIGEVMQLLETTAADDLATAVSALALIAPAERCSDALALATEASPQPTPFAREVEREIEVAAVHARASTSRAVALATEAVTAARATRDPRLVARALLVRGHALLVSDIDAAVAPLHEALALALAAGDDASTAEAFARYAYAFGNTIPDPLRALDGLELATAIARRAGPRGAFARALLANNVGVVAGLARDYPRDVASLREAVAAARWVEGPDAAELTTAISNLAMLTPDRDERGRLFADALGTATATVGPDHPVTLTRRLQAISDELDAGAVVRDLDNLCQRFATLHPSLVALVETCAFELAWQAAALGDDTTAHRAGDLAALGPTPVAETLLLRVYARGDVPRAAVEVVARDAAKRAAVADALWSHKVAAADAELALATLGERTAAHRAIEHLEAAVAEIGVTPGLIQRRLDRAHALDR